MLVASTLGARTSTLDARCTHLDARCFGASTLGARTSTLDARRSAHAPRRSMLRRSTLSALTPRRLVHAPQRFDARCTHLEQSCPGSTVASPARQNCRRAIPMRTVWRAWDQSTPRLPWQTDRFAHCALIFNRVLFTRGRGKRRAPPAESLASHSAFQPQPLAVPVVQQPQGVWDVDAISRDASEGEPLLEEDSPETDLASQHSEHDSESEALETSDPLWSLVERATRHLGIEWQAMELPRRSLFESRSVHSPLPRMLPAFLDFIKEGASEAGLASFSPVDAAFAALVKTPTLSGLVKDPACPNKQCRTTEIHLKKGYLAATEAVRLSNVASLLSVYQASLVKDLPEHPSASLRAELALVAQFLVKIAQLNARAQGRSIASLVVARRQLWLSQARVQEPDKVPLLDAPITPGHTFGPAVEEMLQRSVKAWEASQQMAKMWPHKPFQPRRQQEHQWRRAPPQHQPRPGGTKTSP
ncbi:UNVERIFIED_CONTAM: hypothetical protein FKN15_015636 [Acipenser sinensis]